MWSVSNSIMACAVCGTTENLQRCGQCRMVVYCGVEHQRAHWPVHSMSCVAYPMNMDVYGQDNNQPEASGAGTEQQHEAQPEQEHQKADEAQQQQHVAPQLPQKPEEQPQQQNVGTAHAESPAENPLVENAADAHVPPPNDKPKPNQKTLDGRAIFLPENEKAPSKLSMSNLPTRGSSVTMEEGPAYTRARPENDENVEPPQKKRRVNKRQQQPVEPVAPKEPTPPAEEEYIIETLWKSTLGMLVFREDKGYYGDGPDFEWEKGTKYLTDVKTKKTKGNRPVTEKWGKWCWDEKVYGPNNFGRFKIRIAANGMSFKGTWGWGSRNRGGGPWTGTFVEETRVPIRSPEMLSDAFGVEEEPLREEDHRVDNIQAQDDLDVALCHAAVAGEPEKISSLIAQGADVNNRLVEKCTPVMHAVVMDYAEVVKALLKAPVDLNARDQQGCTALHICAEHGHVECAEVILEAADFEAIAEKLATLMSLDHPLRNHPKILARIAAFASPLDISIKNDAGQSVFDLIMSQQSETGPALGMSRNRIADLMTAHQKKVDALFAVSEEPVAARGDAEAHMAKGAGAELQPTNESEGAFGEPAIKLPALPICPASDAATAAL